MRRSRATVLMTCPLCSQYFDDPRLLPCSHTFCRKCLQKYIDQKQSDSLIRVGRITCPKCKTMIGIPMSGVEGFPVDKKMSGVKDLVIDELAEDISKGYHSHSQSDSLSSHSDHTDSGDIGETLDDAAQRNTDFTRSRSRFTRSDATSDGSDRATGSSSSFAANSFYPNMSKYAKYFVKDDETISSDGYKPHFRPAVRAERHRVGYSSSFQLRRRRINVEPPKGFDDTSDILRQSRYRSAPHIGRGSSSNIPSSYNDIFEQMPQSSEDLTKTNSHSSGIFCDYDTTRERRYPGPSTKFSDDDFGEATASMPSLSKTRDERTSGVDPGMSYSNMQNTFSEPKFSSSAGVGKPDLAPSNDSDAFSKRSWKVPEETRQKNYFEMNGSSGSTSDRYRGNPENDPFQGHSDYSEKPRVNLPTHRENVITHENERPFQEVNFREGLRSRSRITPRSHSTTRIDNHTFPHGETKRDPNENYFSNTPSTHSFTPRSPLIRNSRINKTNDGLYNECKTEEYQAKEPLQKENVHSWYHDAPDSKKFDAKFTRTEPDGVKMKRNFHLRENSSTFHKSASFSTNHWEDRLNQGEDSLRNYTFMSPSRRKTYYRNVNGSFSAGSLNQFDGCIKFELKKRNDSKKKLFDQDQDDSDDDYESEIKQRNDFNERILNMRMNRYLYEIIMSDFKNGNLCSEINLSEEAIDDENCADDDADKTVREVDATLKDESLMDEDAPKVPDGSSSDPEDSEGKAITLPEKSELVIEKPAPEEVGHNLKEMIEAMRAKYQPVNDDDDVDERSPTLESVILQPSYCDTVTPKWNFQKTEFAIPTAIAITSNGRTIVADYGNSCLEFFDSDGNYEHMIDGIKPFSIAVNNLDQIIVGDRKGKAVRVFDDYGADVSQWEAGLVGWISGLAILANGNVVVHDRDRCKIGIYSSGGEKIKEFASYGVSDSQLCMADFLTVDSKNRIVVADSGNHCLKLFDIDGKFISKIASRGKEDGCLEWPKGVCVDSMDNIIVADSQNNRISMFSASGQFVQHLITTAPSPYSVGFSPSTKLLGVTHYALTGFSQYDVYQCLQ